MHLLALPVSRTCDHGSTAARPAPGGGARELPANPRRLLFLGVAFAGSLSPTAANNSLIPYMEELGAGEAVMGVARTVGTIIEYPILFFGNRLIRIVKPHGLFMLSMAATGLRLVLMGLTTSPDAVLAIQLLNGLSFPAMSMAGVACAYENAPPGLAATAQGLFGATVFGIGMDAGGFLGGPLLEALGGRGLFLTYGIIALSVAAGSLTGRLLIGGAQPASARTGP